MSEDNLNYLKMKFYFSLVWYKLDFTHIYTKKINKTELLLNL